MKRFLTIATLCLLSVSALAQYKWDYGLALGGANYLGDIGGLEKTRRDFVWDMHLKETNIAVGLYGRYKFSKRISLAANLSYLQISDDDNNSTNPARRARNLNFRNNIFEFGLRGELTIYYDNDVGGRGYYNPDFKLYLFGGVSGFMHNPQGQITYDPDDLFDNTWYNLREWKTEDRGMGEYEEYGLFGLALPAGIGMYFTFDKKWRVGWELSWRTTFTDYLDDISTNYGDPTLLPSDAARAFVSQSNQGLISLINDPDAGSVFDHQFTGRDNPTKRGDATNNDSYLTSQITIGRVIRGRSQFYRAKYSWLKNRTGARKSRAKF